MTSFSHCRRASKSREMDTQAMTNTTKTERAHKPEKPTRTNVLPINRIDRVLFPGIELYAKIRNTSASFDLT